MVAEPFIQLVGQNNSCFFYTFPRDLWSDSISRLALIWLKKDNSPAWKVLQFWVLTHMQTIIWSEVAASSLTFTPNHLDK